MTRKLFNLILAVVLIAAILSACAPAAKEQPTLKMALLPIIDALPMYVAQQEGLFSKHGVQVELIPVSAAPERDQVLAAGQADGTINETHAVIQFNKEKPTLQIVRYALRPTTGAGHFFILASPKSGITSPDGLKGVEIGVSQGTVIEYVTERLLQAQGLTADDIKTIAVPKLSDRMALLASGDLKAGTLPDPLASLTAQQGAVVVLDDSAYPQYGYSVISFRKEVIDANPEAIQAFLKAIEEAVQLVNADPAKYASLLADNKIVPQPILSSFKTPPFPAAGVPTEAEWNDALSWMKEKGLVASDPLFADGVNAALLP